MSGHYRPLFTTMKLYDTNKSHLLTLTWNENEATANRTLNVKVNGADRTLDLSGNLTVEAASIVNQDLSSDATPTFAGLITADASVVEIGAAGTIQSGATNGDTLLLKANDTTFITLTTGATDTMSLGAWTAGGTVSLGGQSISGTNFTLKTSAATDLVVRNAADDADGNLGLRSLLPTLNVDFQTDGALIRALGSDGAYFAIQARDTGVGFVEIARAVGAADPYFSFGGSQQHKFYNSGAIDIGSGTTIACAGTGANGMILKNPKNAAASALSGTQLDVEIDIGGAPYYFTVYPTKV